MNGGSIRDGRTPGRLAASARPGPSGPSLLVSPSPSIIPAPDVGSLRHSGRPQAPVRPGACGTVPRVTHTDGVAERILTVTAHPDDIDFGAAGSVAAWTAAGASVTYCVVTDGDAGGFDPSVPRREIPAIRRAEQTAAAAEVGVKDLVWLGYPDGRVEASLSLRRDLARVIRQVRPQRVSVPEPGPRLGPALRQPPRPSGDRGGNHLRRVPRRPKPLRLPGAGRRGPRTPCRRARSG